MKKTKDLDRQIAENKKAAGAYALDHVSDWNKVSEILQKDGKIPPSLAAVAGERDKFNQKDRELKKALAEGKEAVEREKRNVQLSLGDTVDVENTPGEMTTKDVELSLTIAGQPQSYVMGLRKYELQAADKAPRTMNRWVVQSLEPKK